LPGSLDLNLTSGATEVIKEQSGKRLNLMPGDVVEVRSAEEILNTLDQSAELDNLPFMPEMLQFCGKQYEVYRRADKTCDTIDNTGGLRMLDSVHLQNLRCDGKQHGGCEAECLLFWKESWLRRVDNATVSQEPSTPVDADQLHTLTENTSSKIVKEDGNSRNRFFCQATELKRATAPLQWWDIRQYWRDIRIGNARVRDLFRAGILAAYRRLVEFGVGYRLLLRLYDGFQDLIGGIRYPYRSGTHETKTPSEYLDLKVGEFVRVRSHEDILKTLDRNSKNRGLWFDAEMVPFCGKTFRVSKRVTKIVHEKTGEMIHFTNPCIVLDKVCCRGKYTRKRLFCPRSIPSYWREIWLERVDSSSVEQPLRRGGP
jgi:hypothetical protein